MYQMTAFTHGSRRGLQICRRSAANQVAGSLTGVCPAINPIDNLSILFIYHTSLHFQRWRQFTALGCQLLIQQSDALDLLKLRQRLGARGNLSLEQIDDARMTTEI